MGLASGDIPLATCLHRQKSVTFTIFIRELGVRFGKFRLSYIWALLEPVAFISLLSYFRLQWGRGPMAGVDFPLFFASGIMAYLLFTHIVNSCMSAVESNQGLFNYKQVKPFDILVARTLIEVAITVAAGIIIFAGLHYLGFKYTLNSILELVCAIMLLYLFSCGLGLIALVVGPLFQDAKKIIPIAIRPLFFISGIFFAADQIAEPYRSYLLINPLLHATELIRGSLFKEFQSDGGSFIYLGMWALSMVFVGLMVYRLNRIKILTSGNIK